MAQQPFQAVGLDDVVLIQSLAQRQGRVVGRHLAAQAQVA